MVPAARIPPGATEGGPADMDMEEANDGPCGGDVRGGDHDSGNDSEGSFCAEHPSRPRPAQWRQTTNCQRRPWDRKRGADGDGAGASSGARNASQGGARWTMAKTTGQDRWYHYHQADDETTNRRGWQHGGTAAAAAAAAWAAPKGRQRQAPRPSRRREVHRKWRRRSRPRTPARAKRTESFGLFKLRVRAWNLPEPSEKGRVSGNSPELETASTAATFCESQKSRVKIGNWRERNGRSPARMASSIWHKWRREKPSLRFGAKGLGV